MNEITEKNEALLTKYVELKRTMRNLETEIEALNDVIYSQIEAMGGKLTGPDYAIFCSQRLHYRFSATYQKRQEEMDRLQKQLKELEEQEIRTGVAEVESTTNIVSVRFD
ncbi:MAG: hypothetical protein JW829_18370 [Pirellulales bacterium]|nr:hypothetical protein [Pirellulales bacterium]